MNYIEFFSREIPQWMQASNQKAQEVGFGSYEYWLWVVQSMGAIGNYYNDDELVLNQLGLIFDWLEKQAEVNNG